MARDDEWTFYEVMWRAWTSHAIPCVVAAANVPPLDRQLRQRLVRFHGSRTGVQRPDRYWNMAGVKDARQESLAGQAGEIEPICERYAVTFFVTDGARLHLPQWLEPAAGSPALERHRRTGAEPRRRVRHRSHARRESSA
jgi:hypothetical protein